MLVKSAISDTEARDLIERTTWYHRFEIRPGLMTKGQILTNPSAGLDALGVPSSLTGTALDIGAWDGAYTFELERRGASAVAIDIQNPDEVAFNVARRIIGSKARHVQASVYDLPLADVPLADHILFRGVFYHLKHPQLAFERLSAAMKVGGFLYFEGEGLLNYAEDIEGHPAPLDIDAINRLNVPICLVCPNNFRGSSNWYIPNPAALRVWLQSAGFEVHQLNCYTDDGAQRLYGRARKISEWSSAQEHPLYTVS
jgi:tRNA (mo5U34)-methyltransferase